MTGSERSSVWTGRIRVGLWICGVAFLVEIAVVLAGFAGVTLVRGFLGPGGAYIGGAFLVTMGLVVLLWFCRIAVGVVTEYRVALWEVLANVAVAGMAAGIVVPWLRSALLEPPGWLLATVVPCA